jgi:hypothetical protein
LNDSLKFKQGCTYDAITVMVAVPHALLLLSRLHQYCWNQERILTSDSFVFRRGIAVFLDGCLVEIGISDDFVGVELTEFDALVAVIALALELG